MTSKKHRFNIIDALIILVILLFATTSVYMLFFRDSGAEAAKVKIRYVLTCDWMRSEFADNVNEGDRVFDSSGSEIGTVSAVQISEASYLGSDKSDGNPVVTKGVDGYQVLTVTVDADGVNSENKYTVNGSEIFVGKHDGIRFPDLYMDAEFISVEAWK